MTKNTKYSFVVDSKYAVTGATVRLYIEEILKIARAGGLKISGEDLPLVRRGIEQIRLGNLMTVGTSGTHDIDWIERPAFACERSLKPVYDLVDDYKIITKKLVEYIESKALRTLNGTIITFHAGFVKIGREIIPNEVFAAMVAKIKY